MRGPGAKGDFRRKGPSREPRRTVYIICEGDKTEYSYFRAIRRELRLRSVHIEIDPGSRSGSDPVRMVDYALAKQQAEDYDAVWCVFDDDGRCRASEALQMAEDADMGVAFSNPCFELWYLLHFSYSTSACDQAKMEKRLRKHLPGYDKGADVFERLPDRSVAAKNAANLRKHHEAAGNKSTDNPSTNVYELVEFLFALQDPG